MSDREQKERVCRMGGRPLTLGSRYLDRLRSSRDLLPDPGVLRARMEEDGYLYLPGLIDPTKIARARAVLLENLGGEGALVAGEDGASGRIAPGQSSRFWGGRREVTHHPALRDVFESEELFRFFERLFSEAPITFDYKWLRAVGQGEHTGAHVDSVYMGRGTRSRLFTTWIPLHDTPVEMGPLAVVHQSHRLKGFARVRETYGNMDVDRDHVIGFFSDDPYEIVDRFGGQWRTADFAAGDVLIFTMLTMHASLDNTTDRFRLSCDTRFQPASEPIDERWVGEDPMAHYAWYTGDLVTMDEARARWGL